MGEVISWVLVLPAVAALSIYSIEVLFGLRRLGNDTPASASPAVAILIPAHNEAYAIKRTVQNLLEADNTLRVLVVADNCSDDTAALAREAGAECVQRNEPQRLGKGFALASGRAQMARNPPDVVLVLDTDCEISLASIRILASAAYRAQSPVQARNLVVAPPEAPALVQISNFAMLVKNLVRARGLYRLGGGIPLFGTGMAFPWHIFQNAALATSEAVEDLRLGLDLARQGIAVRLVEDACVLSPAAGQDDSRGQRSRWEHGFVRTAIKEALPMIVEGVDQMSRHKLALGLHLCVPPLALLFLIAGVTFVPVLALAAKYGGLGPVSALITAISAALFATALAWRKEGRSAVSAAALARAPLYIVHKIPIYLRLLTSRRAEWHRTRRNNER